MWLSLRSLAERSCDGGPYDGRFGAGPIVSALPSPYLVEAMAFQWPAGLAPGSDSHSTSHTLRETKRLSSALPARVGSSLGSAAPAQRRA